MERLSHLEAPFASLCYEVVLVTLDDHAAISVVSMLAIRDLGGAATQVNVDVGLFDHEVLSSLKPYQRPYLTLGGSWQDLCSRSRHNPLECLP